MDAHVNHLCPPPVPRSKRAGRSRVLVLLLSALPFLFSAPAASQAPSLGSAETYAVLAGSTVTSTGPTMITGDLGVSPGTAVTGLPPGTMTGTLHAGDALALRAQGDLTKAYNALAGAPRTATLTGQDLGGRTLTAGVYAFAASAPLNGVLTLDAQNNPNAVFVFQIGSTLLAAINSSVRVINGAQDANVFWLVGSSATLAAGVAFRGNIIALASITLGQGARLSGRALARTAAVTMDISAIAVPTGVTRPVASPVLTAPVDSSPLTSLGAAEGFAVLGASTVTSTGPTMIAGDLGISPGTAVTGLPPGTMTGTLHAGDALALRAQSHLTAVYNALAGAPRTATLTGQDLGGLTLTAGVYYFTASAPLNGVLTLDAQGNPNAVFVFQIGSTLLVAINSSVRMINGAQDANVFWQVGSSATLAAGVAFRGNIIALSSITLGQGARVSGRALARTAAVTMDSSSVFVPVALKR
jgi:hypothetical protein